MVLSEQAVLKTLLYSDIFNFSLTRKEIFTYLISSKSLDNTLVEHAIDSLISKKIILQKGQFVALFSKEKNIDDRVRKVNLLEKKLALAKRASVILQQVPSIRLIGISGSLAVGNVNKEDDIDLFIISEANKLWITRFFCIVLLTRNKLRRTRSGKNEANKICLNMFLSESTLQFPKIYHDLYTAHEITQLVPLFSRFGVYRKFIDSNMWIRSFLPHTGYKTVNTDTDISTTYNILYSQPVLQFVEFMQRLYMRPHRTTETVTDSLFAFHPRDYRKEILGEYRHRLKQYTLDI